MNILFIGIICFFICLIIAKLFKNFANSDIIDISEYLGGNFLKFIFSILIIGFLLLSTIIVASDFIYLLHNVYFSDKTNLLLIALIITPALIINFKGFFAIKRIICTFIPLLIGSIVFLLIGSTEKFDYNNLLPILGYNIDTTFRIGLQNIFAFNFMLIYFFIMPNLKKKNDFSKIIIISFLGNVTFLLISIISILQLFPNAYNKSLSDISALNSTYIITKTIQFSNYIQQTDALFIFIWSFAIFAYISFGIFGINHILNKLFKFENKNILSFPVISIIIGFFLLVNKINIIKFLENNIFRYYSITLNIGLCFVILILGNIKRKINFKKGIKNDKK